MESDAIHSTLWSHPYCPFFTPTFAVIDGFGACRRKAPRKPANAVCSGGTGFSSQVEQQRQSFTVDEKKRKRVPVIQDIIRMRYSFKNPDRDQLVMEPTPGP